MSIVKPRASLRLPGSPGLGASCGFNVSGCPWAALAASETAFSSAETVDAQMSVRNIAAKAAETRLFTASLLPPQVLEDYHQYILSQKAEKHPLKAQASCRRDAFVAIISAFYGTLLFSGGL
jgi:hypothetical protein